ncbi:hypothetical protein [Streptomyces sp. 1222.5]|uniref:hypothetical protein n=1 Tax=Streptomyces sp. 1222.5 TaxID=1881026 RepID=UPI003EBD520B
MKKRFSVRLTESVTYVIEVVAEDEDEAGVIADEVFCDGSSDQLLSWEVCHDRENDDVEYLGVSLIKEFA